MKFKYFLNSLRSLFVLCLFLLWNFLSGQANGPTLEMAAGANNPTGNGPTTANQTIAFQNNTDNTGTGTTFATYSPTLTATYAISNVQSGQIINFGQTTTGAALIYDIMSNQGGPADANFTTAGTSVTPGTGIVVGTNRAVRLYVQTLPLRTAARPTNSTNYIANLTITFNRPVNNPVMHVGGLGGTSSTTPVLGFAGILELSSFVGNGVSLTRLSGNNATGFQSTATTISNGATTFTASGANSGSGSVRVNGTGITSLTFRISIKGDGANTDTTAWASANDASTGEAFTVGFSTLESDVQLTKTMSNTGAAVGSSVNFVVTATNNGPSNNANINIADALPSGYNFGTPVASAGTYSSGVWNIPTLANGASATLTVTGIVLASGNYSNTATVTSATVSDSNTFNNTATAARLPDSDGDGIFDNTDLDDDNDGIPDAVEDNCTTKAEGTPIFVNTFGTGAATTSDPYVVSHTYQPVNPQDGFYSVTTSGAQSQTYTQTNATGNLDAGYTNISSGSTNGRYLMINVASAATLNLPIYRVTGLNVIPGTNYRFRIDMAGLANGLADVPSLRISIKNSANVELATATSASIGMANDDVWRRLSLDFTATTSTVNIEIINLQANGGNGNDLGLDNIVLTPIFCDTDGDGIPNSIDLDSDGDGCFDAIEGDERVLPIHLNANGSIRTNAAGTPNGDTIATIDANGIPTLVNSGGAADFGSDVGQGVGDSQSSLANTQCIDTDGDGIPDNYDLDDDNDGILDTVEDACETEGTPVYINNFGTGTTRGSDSNVLLHTYVATGSIGDGFYAVTTSGAATDTYSKTNLTGDRDAGNPVITAGSTNGRYLMINVNAPGTVGQAIYRVSNLAVTAGTRYNFRIDMAGLAEGAAAVPDLQLSLKDAAGNILATANSGSIGMANDDVWRRLSLKFMATTSTVTLEIVNLQPNGGGNDLGIDNVILAPIIPCDTDGDGIPNSLDLDSDNDGCFDVIEGGANFQNGASYITGNRLNTAVNANGVPAVPTGTTPAITGYTQAAGQTIGTSQNLAVQDVQCSTAIGCTNAMYLSQTATLYSINTSTNPFTYPAVGTSSVTYNAIGINPIDGRMYGMQTLNSTNIFVINANGTSINLGAVGGLPAGTYTAGEIDNLGNYYVKGNVNDNQMYRINLSTLQATLITLTSNISIFDMAFNVTNNLLYAVNSTNGQLVSINPANGTVTAIGITPGTVSFGAMFGSSTGEIYGSDNAGGFYQFNLTNGQRVLISSSPASSANDGAHCVTTPIAFSADLSVTKTNNSTSYTPGTTTTYTIVARNNGPFGVLGATVSDPLPTGITAANMSYTAAVAGGATTSVSGTQTGAINDVVNLPVNATVTYTVTVSIPLSFTGNLVNTVTITSPSNSTDPNTANNTATDTDTAAVCYRPGLTTGGAVLDTNHGITSLNRAGNNTAAGNWPMVRKGAWTALESKTKGFVVNRLTTAQIAAIPSANLIEGMMVYNIDLDCLQVNTTGTAAGWSCFNTQTCPTN